jgi:hypothetical protein
MGSRLKPAGRTCGALRAALVIGVGAAAFAPAGAVPRAAAQPAPPGEAHAVAQDRAGTEALAFAGDATRATCDPAQPRGWCLSARYTRLEDSTAAEAFGGSRVDVSGHAFTATLGAVVAPGLSLGAALRAGNENDAVGSLGRVSSDHAGVALSARHENGRVRLDATAGRLWGEADVLRAVAVGPLAPTAAADYDVAANFARFEASYAIPFGPGALAPFAAAAGAWSRRAAFSERGADAANLAGAANRDAYGHADAGARLWVQARLGAARVTPEFTLAYSRRLGEARPDQPLRFAAGGPDFAAFGARHDRDRLRVGGAINAPVASNVGVFLRYDGLISGSDDEHRVAAGLRAVF